jgi:hypothetical protein
MITSLNTKMYSYISTNWLQANDENHPSYLSGPMETKSQGAVLPSSIKKVKIWEG